MTVLPSTEFAARKSVGLETKGQTLSWLPKPSVPYAELIRLHKPVGVFNIYFPYLFECILAACLNGPGIQSYQVTRASVDMFAVAFVLRSMGCAWNDIIDRDLDSRTERCRSRPMARGAIPLPKALLFVAALLACWVWLLYTTATPSAIIYAIPVPFMTAIYPFTKRFTSLAQLALGLTLSIGVFVGAAQLDLDIVVAVQTDSERWKAYSLISLFCAYVTFSVFHDTIYAFQDIKDDKINGAKSTAILLEDHPLIVFSIITVVQIATLTSVGAFSKFGPEYYLAAVGGTGALYGFAIYALDINSPKDCFRWFKITSLGFGALVALGLTWQFAVHLKSPPDQPHWRTQNMSMSAW